MKTIVSNQPADRVTRKGPGFWLLQSPGWLLLLYLIAAQGIPAFDYELGIAMGTQESAEQITEVGVAFWKGFALGDVLTYIPLLAAGLIGHFLQTTWGRIILAAALGITVYWPAVILSTVIAARGAEGWNLAAETSYWIVLPPMALWAVWGLWRLTWEIGQAHLRN